MSNGKQFRAAALLFAALGVGPAFVTLASAGAREEGRLLTATRCWKKSKACRTSGCRRVVVACLWYCRHSGCDKVAFIFGGRHGNGVLVVRDKLTSPWSNPVFISLTGGSWGFQAGAQSSDIILVFTTKTGVEGIAGGS